MLKKRPSILIGLTVLLLAAMLLSVCLGAVAISARAVWSMLANYTGISHLTQFTAQQQAVLVNLRLPRVVLGALIGSALAISGASIQGLFRNPLAEPGLIGISSGATLFATLTIVLGGKLLAQVGSQYGYYMLSAAAFLGAAVTAFTVYRIAMNQGRTHITALLLAGIAINALAFSLTGLLTFISTDEQLRNITFWSLGSLGGASWTSTGSALPFIVIPLLILPWMGKQLNALSLGEDQAQHLGVNVTRIKRVILILATMAVGASVAVAGMISFVGLVIPHLLRMGFGADNRFILPASTILGAVVLTLADLVSRTIVSPAELPIGVVTALSGSPVFIYMIITQLKKRQI